MKLIEFKNSINKKPSDYSLPMFFLEEQPTSSGNRKLIVSKFYNGFIIVNTFYKNIHRII